MGERLLLVLGPWPLTELRTDARLRAAIDGVSVRNRLATLPLLAWLEQQRLTTFVWTVNDEAAHERAARARGPRAHHRPPRHRPAARLMTWGRAVRSLAAAVVLVLAVVVVAGNFVLVQVRILGLGIETRLAWAIVVPAAIAFWAGTVWSRTGHPVPSTPMPGTPTRGHLRGRPRAARRASAARWSSRASTVARDRDRHRGRCAPSPTTPPDVLVLDIGLPDADGRDVCQALRAQRRRRARCCS